MFEANLTKAKLNWTPADPTNEPLLEGRMANLTGMDSLHSSTTNGKQVKDWHAAFRFPIHLVPVESVSGLRHQFCKLSLLESGLSEDAAAVEGVFDLHPDSHDAKFEGGEGATGARSLMGLFESEALFRRACPEDSTSSGSHIPRRVLRDMLRFGSGETRLMDAFRLRKQAPIPTGEGIRTAGNPRVLRRRSNRSHPATAWCRQAQPSGRGIDPEELRRQRYEPCVLLRRARLSPKTTWG